MSACTDCGRPGTPYEYHGTVFDGLTAYHGKRLCRACTDANIASDGVNIRCVNPANGDVAVVNSRDLAGKAYTGGRWR